MNSPPDNDQILGLILSGGASRRHGGRDKGLLNYQGKPLVSSVADRLQAQVNSTLISIHRNQAAYAALGHRTVMDASTEYLGPMAGICAALNSFSAAQPMRFDYWVIAPCDAPHLPNDYVLRLLNSLKSSRSLVAIAHDGERRQNLHCMIHARALPSLADFFASGGRAMHRWFNGRETVDVDFSDRSEAFTNINTPDLLGD